MDEKPRLPEGDVVARSPFGNFLKFPEVLGRGAFKVVYKGQDVNNGNLIAWNEVAISRYAKRDRQRIMNEIKLLRNLTHPHLLSYYGCFMNKEADKVVFVTELMSSGTLRDFCGKYPIPLKTIKRYCREVLECMSYLHTPIPRGGEDAAASGGGGGTAASGAGAGGDGRLSDAGAEGKTVLIHRDLKCDNIFIMAQGKGIKIGDLGLATSDGRSLMGTPEFMAPEMYEMGYGTSVDVYAFGLCVLEMVTGRTPYCECNSVVAIYKRVLAGTLPENIRVLEHGWPEAFAFVLRCLTPLPELPVVVASAEALAASPSDGLPLPEDDDEDDEDEDDGDGSGGGGGGGISGDGIGGARVASEASVAAKAPLLSASSGEGSGCHTARSADSSSDGGVGVGAPVDVAAAAAAAEGVAGAGSGAQPSAGQEELARVGGSSATAASEAPLPAAAARPAKQRRASLPGHASRIRRSTAAELLQDPFLVACDEDGRTTTEHVRRLSEQRGFFCINSFDDPHRAAQPHAPQLGGDLLATAQAAAAVAVAAKMAQQQAAVAQAAAATAAADKLALQQAQVQLLAVEQAARDSQQQHTEGGSDGGGGADGGGGEPPPPSTEGGGGGVLASLEPQSVGGLGGRRGGLGGAHPMHAHHVRHHHHHALEQPLAAPQQPRQLRYEQASAMGQRAGQQPLLPSSSQLRQAPPPGPSAAGGGAGGSTRDVTLASLAEEVRSLRHVVAHSFGLLEWLVAQAPGGAQHLEDCRSAAQRGSARGGAAQRDHGLARSQESAQEQQQQQQRRVQATSARTPGTAGGRARSSSDAPRAPAAAPASGKPAGSGAGAGSDDGRGSDAPPLLRRSGVRSSGSWGEAGSSDPAGAASAPLDGGATRGAGASSGSSGGGGSSGTLAAAQPSRGARPAKGKSVKFAHSEIGDAEEARAPPRGAAAGSQALSGASGPFAAGGRRGGPATAAAAAAAADVDAPLPAPAVDRGEAAIEALISQLLPEFGPLAAGDSPATLAPVDASAAAAAGDLSPASDAALARVREHKRRDELRAALAARRALADVCEQRGALAAELAAARAEGESKHARAASEFERSHGDITKSLEALAQKRRERGSGSGGASDAAADCAAAGDAEAEEGEGGGGGASSSSGVGRRERAEEDLYVRKRELLLSRRADEQRASSDALAAADEAHAVGVARCAAKEREALDAFAARIAALRASIGAAGGPGGDPLAAQQQQP